MYGFVPALTSFVGRAGPVREVTALLDRNRLVTVTGPGGAGKTRLAGQVANQVVGGFADGAWLAELAPVRDPADPAGALGHFTAARDAAADRPPSRALTAALAGRATALRQMGRTAEAASDGRRALALARQLEDPAGELMALMNLSLDAAYAGHHDEAVRLARQAGQITAGIPGGYARTCSYVLTIVLADAGDLAEAAAVAPTWPAWP